MHTKSVGYDNNLLGLLRFWTNLIKQETYQDGLIPEVQVFMAHDINFNYESPTPRSPQNLLTPFDFSDAPVFDYVTKRSTSQDQTIGNVLIYNFQDLDFGHFF